MELAREGALVVINGRSEEKLRIAQSEIQNETGNKVLALSGDVANEADVRDIVSEAAGLLGPVHLWQLSVPGGAVWLAGRGPESRPFAVQPVSAAPCQCAL